MTQREDVLKFEQGRIKALQEERLHIQKKTFTKWMNSFLQKARMEVDDLFTDLADGRKLLKLLEIISGEKLAKPNTGRMRVHKIENVNKSLAFLHTKVRLESIGAEDIVDGNPRLILGLIWTIILRFQIQEIEIDVDEENESSEKKSAKDALLLWCQRKTSGYQGVHIQDFTSSWRSGLGFNALIHSHRPDLFVWSSLQPGKHIENLNHAFDVAHSELGIPKLLDAEDVDTNRPDEKSVITYVASYYHTFARMKNEMKSGRRIANIVGQMVDADKKKVQFERLTSKLLEWILLKVRVLEDREFPNSLEGIQKELLIFKQYRTIEKPPKYKERSEIEALFFHINTLLKSLNQPLYTPQDGQLIQDIEKAWEGLERAEHSREVALREELLRQERLEQLNYKFERKSVLREGYLKEMIHVLSDPRYGSNVSQVDATVKKHEAISADIFARAERFNDLTNMADELHAENYHGRERVKLRENEVLEKWRQLLVLLDKHKNNLNLSSNLMIMLREVDTTLMTIQDLQSTFKSEDVGPHLLGVEELLQQHSLQELQVGALGETQRRLGRQCQQYLNNGHKEATLLAQGLEKLNKAYADLLEHSKKRRTRLEDARNLFHFLQDHEDEERWVVERQRICKAGITAKDLRAVFSLQQKHKALQDEMKARKHKSEQLCDAGRKLQADKHPRSAEIQQRAESLLAHWKLLHELVDLRKKQLEDAAEAYQFYTDANEAESWLNEKMALVTSTDYGTDEPSAQALLQRHRDLQGELNAYSGDIHSLNIQADKLVKSGINTLELSNEHKPIPEEYEQEEWVNETRLVPTEVWEDEPVERFEHITAMEERSLPQVKSNFAYSGQGMNISKGEIMILLNKTNDDWWSVRKADGTDGFVPANHVREIEPRIIPVQVRRPQKVKTVQKVKKTILVKKVVPVKRVKSVKVTPKTAVIKQLQDDGHKNVENRQKRINETYNQLQELAQRRHALLEDSICLYGFFRECDDFEKWIHDKEKLLKAEDKTSNVDTAKRKYEKFLTDLSASSKRIDSINSAVDEFTRQGHSQIEKVKARQKQINQLWDNLNWLKSQTEKNLEGASSVELFHRTCDEASDWMNEKMTQLDTAELGPDLKTVQALQRRHKNLERELAPVEEKVKRVNLLANSVKVSYPNERANVDTRQKEILRMWNQVKEKAIERRSRLENAVGQQIFMNSSKNLLDWVDGVKEQMKIDETVRDVMTAENLQKQHMELGDEIKAHHDEFREIIALGKKLVHNNPNIAEVPQIILNLESEEKLLKQTWDDKAAWLKQCLELQLLNREADQIDATTSGHEAYLEINDLGNSIDDVEALLKRHLDFESTLNAQDERLRAFGELADKLVKDNHYDKNYIKERKRQVIERRQAVKNLAQTRYNALLASKNYQVFSAEVDDCNNWCTEKMKTATDDSYKDLSNLERKLQKHEAFERELRANEGQLRNVNKTGQSLISQNNRGDEIAGILDDLNRRWEALVGLSRDKGHRLRQAANQHGFNKNMEDTQVKLIEIRKGLQSEHVGHDLRSCKDLIKKHQALESEISLLEVKILELVTLANEMAHEGHFDGDNIVELANQRQKEFNDLQAPVKKRQDALQESLKFHKYGFELEAEMQWIRDHLPQASSETIGQNLHQAQSLQKKHRKLEAEIQGHQPMIDKTLASGKSLIEQNHPEKEKVSTLCVMLEEAWRDLEEKAAARAIKLDLSLKAQQYFSEASEIESWLSEKNNVLSSTDYGRDRDAATKLLTKHKAIELELDTYSGIMSEMGHGVLTMVAAKHPDAKAIQTKQQFLEQQLKVLQRLSVQRQQRLMESMYRHEYFLESADLEQWIKEQMQTASSEDYGQDYEHLLVLQAKFNDLKHRIETGSKRFNQCEELAKKLIANDSPYINEIEKRQEHLQISWQQLLRLLQNREQRLQAAGEIHLFNRDVAEALSRIQDKDAALSDDLGRDLNSVLSLIRKHEGFENDLVALEAQLQVLVEDAARLNVLYPGNNATQISQQQDIVISNWEALKERSALRRDQLQASCDLQRFLTQVRDLTNWASGVRATLLAEEKVRDAAGAQSLKGDHDAIKGEIETREENFRNVVDLGEAMVQTGHYAAAEVDEKCSALLDERQKLHTAWQHKKVHLDQLIDLHFFLRDAKQIDNLSSTQEAALKSSDFGQSVEVVDAQVKKHDAFEKLIHTQEEKVAALQEHGSKLVEQNHFDSDHISRRMDEVLNRRKKVKELCIIRRQKLEDALLYARFVRDCEEAESWINEKQKKLEADADKGDVTTLEDKIKKLQKHQAFQAEVSANEGRMQEIEHKANTLLSKKHKSSPEIKQMLENLMKAWKQLLHELAKRGRGLEEAQDILEFNNQLEKIEAWIRDKELMVQANDTGRDYEHCMALQRKLDDVDSDMRVDDARIKSINALSDKLMNQGPTELKAVQQRRDVFNNKWRALQGALSNYRNQLAGALEIHLFNRDIDDTLQRVTEKAATMKTDDIGRDLYTVEYLQRKQETLERDMTAIEEKLKEHEKDSVALSKKYPHKKEAINEKLQELKNNWQDLQQLINQRREKLKNAYVLQKFKSDLRELETWVADAVKKMNATDLPATIAEAEAQLELHQERKAEIGGREDTFKALKEFGHNLSSKGNPDIDDQLAKLDNLHKTLYDAWEERKRRITQAHQLQLFKEQANQIETWLSTKEAFLNNDDLGDTYSAVELLIRKHENFEKMLMSQLNRIDELDRFAQDILAEDHYDSNVITQRLNTVKNRRDKLIDSSALRKKQLEQSQQLQQFLRNMYEVETWLHQKIQVVNDENYRDPSNLQSKIQKHAAFDSELTANKGRVIAITNEGQKLTDDKHYASAEIEEQLGLLKGKWQKLLDITQIKKTRLEEAYQALLFGRMLDEFCLWMDEVETHLQSEDHGKDLISVNNLLRKHLVLENDVQQHADNCESIKSMDNQFLENNHFMKDEIHEKAMNAIKRYYSLQEPMQIRRDNLEDALLLQQFLRDTEDELQWLDEKRPQAESVDLGSSLTVVQSLQKKHQLLESELLSREPIVSNLNVRAQQMMRSCHYAAEKIEEKCNTLNKKLSHLRDLASVRRLRLLDAVESQMFYAEVSEADAWIREKYPILVSNDYGKDEDSVLSLQKKLESLKLELKSFENSIEKLTKLAQGLIDRGHFDKDNIKIRQAEIEKQFDNLKTLSAQREKRLAESKKFYHFIQMVEEVQEWINDQISIADSEDYGTDVEHVELLIKTFDTFVAGLMASESRITNCLETGKKLIEEGNPCEDTIQDKMDETKQLWEDLRELAHVRQEALAGAKLVHVFDRNADETISWIGEKESNIATDNNYQDLEAIQSLARQHHGFESDLAAVKERMDAVILEATRLADIFPDAKEHIDVKREATLEAWTDLLEKAEQKKDKLAQAEQLQVYFDEYRVLMAWINEMMAKITSAELAQDVQEAEVTLSRHNEYKSEIDTRIEAFTKFYKAGQNLIENGHFQSEDIQEKIAVLAHRKHQLDDTWDKRMVIYEQNLDTQLFKRDADLLENWLQSRESQLHDDKLGETIPQVEDLIRKHEDFQKTIEAQEEKFNALNRITMIERAFQKQLQEELLARQAERERVERERVDARKRKEVQRITDERRREEDRRRIGPDRQQREDILNGTSKHLISENQQAANSTKENEKPYDNGQDVSVHKSNSIAHMFGNKLRKDDPSVKRAESMKVGGVKIPKRTPSFTTRRRTQSFRKLHRMDQSELPPVEIQGYVERKHELQSGRKKAAVRSWKPYYAVLCGQLLCFFKDESDFAESKAATSPIVILHAKCEQAEDYTKKKYVFRLICVDGSEFLFLTPSEKNMQDWINKISFHANLPPNLQLLSYDESQKEKSRAAALAAKVSANSSMEADGAEISSNSSRSSSPLSQRRLSLNAPSPTKTNPQTQFLQQHMQTRRDQVYPEVALRPKEAFSSTLDRSYSHAPDSYNDPSITSHYTNSLPPTPHMRQPPPPVPVRSPNVEHMRRTRDEMDMGHMSQPSSIQSNGSHNSDNWRRHTGDYSNVSGWGHSRIDGGRASSLLIADSRLSSDGMSESDHASSSPVKKEKDKRNGMFNFLRRREKRQSHT